MRNDDFSLVALCFSDKSAKLFAAAPELLAACEEVMEFLTNGTPIYPGALMVSDIVAAIRKAKEGAS